MPDDAQHIDYVVGVRAGGVGYGDEVANVSDDGTREYCRRFGDPCSGGGAGDDQSVSLEEFVCFRRSSGCHAEVTCCLSHSRKPLASAELTGSDESTKLSVYVDRGAGFIG